MSEYRMVEIEGKHGIINLGIPEKEPTQEEINELHKTVAEVVVNTNKHKRKTKEKATSK